MKIEYGVQNRLIDTTLICFTTLNQNGIITIPANDHIRTTYFTDPVPNVVKKIVITNEDGNVTEYDDKTMIRINLENNEIESVTPSDIETTLLNIQNNLILKYGTFEEEGPEQRMAIRYLTGNEKVLEIGGNIGRNSLIIASLLAKKYNTDFVTLECDTKIAEQLRENRDNNGFLFSIETSALSKRNLIQRGWTTIESNEILPGYKPVQTITLEQLQLKYNIVFDTLILDCEGAFYYILMDMPEILDSIQTIIVENDYTKKSHKKYVDGILQKNKFMVHYRESGGWGPNTSCFFEVWKKTN